MKWFVARLVFRVRNDQNPHRWQIDEQLRIFLADDMTDALTEAMISGEEFSTKESDGSPVQWLFAGVADIFPVPTPENGSLLHTSTVETESAPEYMALQQTRISYFQSLLTREAIA